MPSLKPESVWKLVMTSPSSANLWTNCNRENNNNNNKYHPRDETAAFSYWENAHCSDGDRRIFYPLVVVKELHLAAIKEPDHEMATCNLPLAACQSLLPYHWQPGTFPNLLLVTWHIPQPPISYLIHSLAPCWLLDYFPSTLLATWHIPQPPIGYFAHSPGP